MNNASARLPITGQSSKPTTALATQNRPIYIDRLPPCNAACPAGENIQQWLNLAQDQHYEEAWRVLVRDNPMPAIHGRVCYHPCENDCNRKRMDQPVSIHAVERFLGDMALECGWVVWPGRPTGKHVLVIGSGPCGLSAAYHLTRFGHRVTVYEAGAKLGGMMRYGIPEYRLPRDILDGEIERIRQMGVSFYTRRRVDDLNEFLVDKKFDAVLLAIGAQLGKRVEIPAPDAKKIIDALKFLANTEESKEICIGRKVAVYGGGNTAMDAARTALRLGAQESIIIYRRNREKMPAHESELEEALTEGVVVNWLRTIKYMGDDDIEVEKMELDDKGYPRPTGKTETLKADVLVLALGQETQSEFLKKVPNIIVGKGGEIQVNDHLMTGQPGVFAGGDMIPADKTVTVAVGHGKKAARHIDAYLRGETYVIPAKHSLANYDLLRVDWYSKSGSAQQPVMPTSVRIKSFDETIGGLNAHNAYYEARRCLSCGNCFECDTCYNVCPDQTIFKLGPGKRFYIDMTYCSRCGLCVQECPCGAMAMMNDSKASLQIG
ncbi:MAG TPA: NAD(P)-binding protein [Tepidisphaeraceae bacterium]|nr:NAD(P)-binding protein [Tepidisphaeraceae bacterium]